MVLLQFWSQETHNKGHMIWELQYELIVAVKQPVKMRCEQL